MESKQKKRGRSKRVGYGRDQLARAAMQVAPGSLFGLLTQEGGVARRANACRGVQRLDAQMALTRWQVDGVYLRRVGHRAELWLVELQSRARGRSPWRSGTVLAEAIRQVVELELPEDTDVKLYLAEVRTEQVARRRRIRGEIDADDPDDELMYARDPLAALDFQTTNRLLLDGPWRKGLLMDPRAWPLWAFGRSVDADALFDRIMAVRPWMPRAVWIMGLMRWIGRVRFPDDERFMEAREEDMEAVVTDLTEMVADGQVTAAEREEYAREYLAQLEAQRERWRQEGREERSREHMAQLEVQRERWRAEGREEGFERGREALLDLAGTFAPESVSSLQEIERLDELQEAVKQLLAGSLPEG